MRLIVVALCGLLPSCVSGPPVFIDQSCEAMPMTPELKCKAGVEGASDICGWHEQEQCVGITMDIKLLDGGFLRNQRVVIPNGACYQAPPADFIDVKSCVVHAKKK